MGKPAYPSRGAPVADSSASYAVTTIWGAIQGADTRLALWFPPVSGPPSHREPFCDDSGEGTSASVCGSLWLVELVGSGQSNPDDGAGMNGVVD